MRKHITMLPQFVDYAILDVDFDAAYDDAELLQAIARRGCSTHPDTWGGHDPLSLLPPRWRRKSEPVRHYHRVDHHAHGEPHQQYDPLPWEYPHVYETNVPLGRYGPQ